MQRSRTAQERAFVRHEMEPFVAPLRTDAELKQRYGEFCVRAGANVLTIGTRIKHLLEAQRPVDAFMALALIRFTEQTMPSRKCSRRQRSSS